MLSRFYSALTSWSGWALVLLFLYTGLQAIQGSFTGNVAADIGVVISILGFIMHPVTVAGVRLASRSVPKQ